MVEKYRYTQNVPYWQNEEILKWIYKKINSNKTQENLPLIEGSSSYINRINQIIPIVAYITIRPKRVIEGTKKWLTKHSLPSVPVICRLNELAHSNGNTWKAKILEDLYPKVLGIIDDNAKLLEFLSSNYKGKIFMYEHHDNFGFPFAVACKGWFTVYEEVKRYILKIG